MSYAQPRSNRGQHKSAVSQAVKTLVLGILVFLFSASEAHAQIRTFEQGRGEVAGSPNPQTGQVDAATIKGIEAILNNVLSAALAFAAIVLFVMFLIGGFRYLTSGGDAKAAEAARGTLTHAILGLVVLIFAYIIIQFIEVFTGVNVSMFTIYRR